jgi:hypothetical protein
MEQFKPITAHSGTTRESMAEGLGNTGSFMQIRLDKQGRFYGRNVSGQQ